MSIPASVDNVTSIAAKVNDLVRRLPSGDRQVRKDLVAAARSLSLAVEEPMEAVLRMNWAELALHAAMQIAVDLNLFEKIPNVGEKPREARELAAMVSADPGLLASILRHLAAMGIVHETGPDLYEHTALSKALIKPEYHAAVAVASEVLIPVNVGLRRYHSENNYKRPKDSRNGPFQSGLQTRLPFFEWLGEHPETATSFNNQMSGYSLSSARWSDPGCVPVKDVLAAPDSKKGVLLVDVGGGRGHDIALFKKQHPDLPGRLILQDLPSVVEGIGSDLSAGVEVVGHDFFTAQPIKGMVSPPTSISLVDPVAAGASAYCLHSVLHDWPAIKCREILSNTVPAMQKGHSKILINERVITKTGNHWQTTALDILMMALFCGHERTVGDWHELVESAGLKISKIWNFAEGCESLIEAELA